MSQTKRKLVALLFPKLSDLVKNFSTYLLPFDFFDFLRQEGTLGLAPRPLILAVHNTKAN